MDLVSGVGDSSMGSVASILAISSCASSLDPVSGANFLLHCEQTPSSFEAWQTILNPERVETTGIYAFCMAFLDGFVFFRIN